MNILNPLEIFGTRLRPKIPVTRSAAAILQIMTQLEKIPPPTPGHPRLIPNQFNQNNLLLKLCGEPRSHLISATQSPHPNRPLPQPFALRSTHRLLECIGTPDSSRIDSASPHSAGPRRRVARESVSKPYTDFVSEDEQPTAELPERPLY